MITSDEVISIAAKVLEELVSRELTIAIAESCTGGLATSFLTDFDGSSDVLHFSVITYSRDAKEEFLGVPSYVFQNFGSVSLECAKVMAEGIVEYDVDIGLATTGVIGESIEGKLKGTVFIAIAIPGQRTVAQELSLNPKLTRYEMKLEIIGQLFTILLEIIDEVF